MRIGFLYALVACFIWGLIFIIPGFLSSYQPIEVILGRYFFYGFLSSVILLVKGSKGAFRYPLKIWGTAVFFGLFANILYYLGVVWGLRYATAPVTVLIMGMAPIVVAYYGNWKEKEVNFKSLFVPALVMAFGIVLVNVTEIDWTFSSYSLKQYVIGLLCNFGALASWSWFAVANARFLKKNGIIESKDWSTMLGIGTFVWALLLIVLLGGLKEIDLGKFLHLNAETSRFFIGASILGFVCSWLGCYFWNQASTYLPVSLMGALVIFETIFGLAFVYLVDFRFPSLIELLGITCMLAGIIMSVYAARKQFAAHSEGINER